MAKRDPLAKRKDENQAQYKMRMALAGIVNAEDKDKNKPNVYAEQHGEYREQFVTNVDDGTVARASLNRGGTPLCRWKAQNKLSETQLAAIGYCLRLWEQSSHSAPVTASYGERMPGGGSEEHRNGAEIDARRTLHRIQDYIPGPYWSVFEAVVRFDQPAGVAGTDLANSSRNAKHTAYLTVCFVADVICMKERI